MECLEALRIFGIGKEDGQRIIGRLGHTLLDEHEKLEELSLPGEARVEGSQDRGEALTVEDESSSIYLL